MRAGFGAKRQRRGSAGVTLDLRSFVLLACALAAATAGLAAVRMYRGLGKLQAGSFSEARARFLRREEVPERPLRRSRPAAGEEEEGAGNGGPEDEQQRGGEDVDYGEDGPRDYALGDGAVEEGGRSKSHEGEAAEYEGDYEGDYLYGTHDYAYVEGALVRSPTFDIDSLVAALARPVQPAAREPVPPQTARLVVLTTQRSGSTFLCAELARRLWGHGFVTWSEPLIPQAWLDHGWRPADVRTAFGFDVEAAWPLYERRLEEAFEEALRIHREGFPARDHGAPAAVGFKVMDNQVPQPLWPRLLEYFRRRQVHVVQLVRVNGLEVFLSKADARARGQWHSYEAAKRAVAPHEVDRFTLHYDLLLHRCSMGRMRAHLADGLAPERVRLLAYETLKAGGKAQVDAQVDAVLRFLGVDPAAAAGAAEVEGRRNWIAEHVPARMAASAGSGSEEEEDVCAGRVANWAEVAEMLAGSLELQLCAGAAGADGLTEAEVAEGLGHLTTYGRREALPEALCAEKYDATFREACDGRPSTIHGCVDYFFNEVGPEAGADGEDDDEEEEHEDGEEEDEVQDYEEGTYKYVRGRWVEAGEEPGLGAREVPLETVGEM